MKISSTTIKHFKQKLERKWERIGPHENFGERELRLLREKYRYNDLRYGTPEQRLQAKEFDKLFDWCINYTGGQDDETSK